MDRKQALYTSRIPCFIFLKSKAKCPACDSFFPIFKELSSDQDFAGKVNFVIMSFGEDPTTKKSHQLPPEYQQLIDNNPNVPLLVLHLPNDEMIIDLGNGQHRNGRTVATMKDTLISALKGTKYDIRK